MTGKRGRRENQWTVGHRQLGTPEYKSWSAMRARCLTPTSKDYPRYGGVGITVCERWDRFEAFLEDMGPRPDGTTLDRINRHLGYSPENCRWATALEQTRNRSVSISIEWAGEVRSLQEWCDAYGAEYSTVHSRLFKHGWPFELALFAPKHYRLHQWRQIAFVSEDFPLRDPGDDAQDETLTWRPAPKREKETVNV